MTVKSLITHRSGLMRLTRRGRHEIRGLAWSGHGRIVRVDIPLDAGSSRQAALVGEPVPPRSLTRFRFDWDGDGDGDGEPAILQSRAFDEAGNEQPARAALPTALGHRGDYD